MGMDDLNEKKATKKDDVDLDSNLVNQALNLLEQSIGGSHSGDKNLPPEFFDKKCINTLPKDKTPGIAPEDFNKKCINTLPNDKHCPERRPDDHLCVPRVDPCDRVNLCASIIEPGKKPEPGQINPCVSIIEPGKKPDPGEINACINI
ncbi:MAG: hypothetical protein K2Z81_09565, partial [Cyanobacteria bacterium]|nr:hypothetical protein [Cyanobacteriota bacterium]